MERLEQVLDFLNEQMDAAGCPKAMRDRVQVAAEEIFVNIASYAYGPEGGQTAVRCRAEGAPPRVTVEFTDWGRPYNPLERPDPDVTLSAGERPMGGLGVFLTKRLMDEVYYQFRDGKNILTLKKRG